MKRTLFFLLFLLFMTSFGLAASPYDGVHLSQQEVTVVPTSKAIYVWIPFVTPKTWVALNPQYLKISTRNLEADRVQSLSKTALVTPKGLADQEGSLSWQALDKPHSFPWTMSQDGSRQILTRGVYRISLVPRTTETTVELEFESNVALDGLVVGLSLTELEAKIDKSF